MQIKFTLLSVLAALFLASDAAPSSKRAKYAIEVNSAQSFCVFLPPHPGDNTSETENDGVPFCTEEGLGGQVFPQGFIQDVNFASKGTFVQIRGTFNRAAYSLSATDDGGQYDHHDVSATCNGYDYFVNILGPDDEVFCIRCCQDADDCNINHSTEGCDVVVPNV